MLIQVLLTKASDILRIEFCSLLIHVLRVVVKSRVDYRWMSFAARSVEAKMGYFAKLAAPIGNTLVGFLGY